MIDFNLIDNIEVIGKFLGYVAIGLGLWYKDYLGTKLGLVKKEKDIDDAIIHNLQQNLDLYQEMIDDLDKRYKAKIAELEESFQASINKLKLDMAELQDLNKKLGEIIRKQKSRLKYYTEKYGED